MNIQLSIDCYTKQLIYINPLALWDDPEQAPHQQDLDFHVINHVAKKQ